MGRPTGVEIDGGEAPLPGADRGRRHQPPRPCSRSPATRCPGATPPAPPGATATGRRRSRSTGRCRARSRGRAEQVARCGHRARRRRRPDELPCARPASARTAHLPERPFLLLGQQSTRRSHPRARRQAHRLGLHPRAAGGRLGARDRAARRAPSRHRSSASRPASASASWPATSSRPPACRARDANLVGGDTGGGSYTLDQVIFRPVPSCSPPTARRSAGSTSAAPRPSPAVRSTAFPAARPRGWRSPSRGCPAPDRPRPAAAAARAVSSGQAEAEIASTRSPTFSSSMLVAMSAWLSIPTRRVAVDDREPADVVLGDRPQSLLDVASSAPIVTGLPSAANLPTSADWGPRRRRCTLTTMSRSVIMPARRSSVTADRHRTHVQLGESLRGVEHRVVLADARRTPGS